MTFFEMLYEVWKITHMKDGAVYKMVFVEERWVNLGNNSGPVSPPDGDPDLRWVASPKEKNWRTVTTGNEKGAL